jgi:hypothetical protein
VARVIDVIAASLIPPQKKEGKILADQGRSHPDGVPKVIREDLFEAQAFELPEYAAVFQ